MGATSVPSKPHKGEVPVRMLLLLDLERGEQEPHWGACCTTTRSFAGTFTLGLAHGALLLLGSESHLPAATSHALCCRLQPVLAGVGSK